MIIIDNIYKLISWVLIIMKKSVIVFRKYKKSQYFIR